MKSGQTGVSGGRSGGFVLFVAVAAMVSLAGCRTNWLVYRAARGELDKVRDLLDEGVDVNATELGRTALSFAAQNGRTKVVMFLLKRGANVNIAAKGWTALHGAAGQGHAGIVRILLSAGANPGIRTDRYGCLPIHQAAFGGHVSTTIALLDAGDYLDARSGLQCTPLHIAALHRRTEVAKYLLSRGAQPNPRDKFGFTALHYACHRWNPPLIRMLLERRADPNATLPNGRTAMLLAALSAPSGDTVAYARISAALVKAGASADHRGPSGRTADELYARRRPARKTYRSRTSGVYGSPMTPHIINSSMQQYIRQKRGTK